MLITRHNPAVSCFFRVPLFLLVLCSLILFIPAEVLAQGCAMCQSVMPHGNEPMARGMFWSVTLLMSAPFFVVGSIGGVLFYCYRRAQRPPRPPAPVLPLLLPYPPKEG